MYADNVALPAFTRRATAAAIDRHLLPTAGPTAANPPHAAAAGERARQTDRQNALFSAANSTRYDVTFLVVSQVM